MKKIILFLLVPSLIFAQGVFVKKGVSSFSCCYGYTIDSYSSNNGLSVILSFEGVFDIGVSYSKLYCDNPNLEGITYFPKISYVIRTSDNPDKLDGISLSAGYISSKVTQFIELYDGKYRTIEREMTGFVFGAAPTFSMYDRGNIAILPTLGVSYTLIYKGKNENTDFGTIGFSIPFRYFNNTLGFLISPSISCNIGGDNQEKIYSIEAGVLLNM